MDKTQADELVSVLRRVKKLLAIAEDGRGDPAEAAAAAGMAERIMAKYQIDHADVILAELNRGEGFGVEEVSGGFNPDGKPTATSWSGRLAVSVAKLHECQARYVDGKGRLSFSGYAADAQMARFTYCFIVNMMRVGGTLWKLMNGAKGAAVSDYHDGYVAAIAKNVGDIIRARMPAETEAGRSLVVVKARSVAAHFGEVSYSRVLSAAETEARAAGFAAGSRVDVNRRGVTGGGGEGQRRLM